jgi:hypothetical protein
VSRRKGPRRSRESRRSITQRYAEVRKGMDLKFVFKCSSPKLILCVPWRSFARGLNAFRGALRFEIYLFPRFVKIPNTTSIAARHWKCLASVGTALSLRTMRPSCLCVTHSPFQKPRRFIAVRIQPLRAHRARLSSSFTVRRVGFGICVSLCNLWLEMVRSTVKLRNARDQIPRRDQRS